MDIFYDILLDNGSTYRAQGDDTLNLQAGDYCIIRRDFYLDYGRIRKIYGEKLPEGVNATASDPDRPSPPSDKKTEIPRIQRKSTIVDNGKANENQMRTKSILRTTQNFVEHLNLPMKLINAHYSFDGKMITIQFSAEGRVDFRELVKLLSQEFNTRIELRQIGVRDETAIIGGISPCGRPLCCSVFLKEFASINVKMAKEQDLSLTPSTISGVCGRLKCCLKYEHEGYLELEKTMPRRGDCCECKEGRGRIIDRNLLTQKVVVQLDESMRTLTYSKDEVNVVYPEKYKLQGQRKQDGSGEEPNAGEDQQRQNNGGRRERDRNRNRQQNQQKPSDTPTEE